MSRAIRPTGRTTRRDIVSAIGHLKLARQYLKDADCPQAVAKVRRALKSAEGAQRHAETRLHRNGTEQI